VAAGFVLGTAQLGLAYGRTNAVGNLSDGAALALLEAAYESGVREIDTARAYGLSEQRIGEFVRTHGVRELRILTKLAPLQDLTPEAREADVTSAVRQSLETSLANLHLDRLPVLMLHRPDHADSFGGAVLSELRRWRENGAIETLGASVNVANELAQVMTHPDFGHIQLPYNLLDRRWPGTLEKDVSRTFHVRSVFLQGLLANPETAAWPELPGYEPVALARSLETVATRLKRQGVRDLAVAYARGQAWIRGCVVGVETPEQLAENLRLFEQPPLTVDEITLVREALPPVPSSLVEPWTWPPVKAA
jgi:aryl-alcohol dehydrogenase-like predicted oxidoreductase